MHAATPVKTVKGWWGCRVTISRIVVVVVVVVAIIVALAVASRLNAAHAWALARRRLQLVEGRHSL